MKKLVPKDAVLIPKSAERVFKGQIFDVYQWQQKMFDGSTETFEMLRRPDTVIVYCVVGDQIIIEHYDQPNVGEKLSLPAGRVDDTDESTQAAAEREVTEETGYVFKNWRLINVIQPHTKIEWFTYFYLAWGGTKQSDQKLDAGERITTELVPWQELKKLVDERAGFLGNSGITLSDIESISDLMNQPRFHGQEIKR